MTSPLPELFLCPGMPGQLRLTKASCAAFWRRGQQAKPWDSVAPCRNCLLGAAHAGAIAADSRPPASLCVRCGKTGARLVVSRQICVSCYNREREARLGVDRRGKRPRFEVLVRTFVLSVTSGALRIEAASLVEAALRASKMTPGALLARRATTVAAIQAGLLQRL